jgi:hypothetical protein
MNEKTLSALSVFEKADWFACVGAKDTDTAQFLSSWQEAMTYCESVDGRNFGVRAVNQFEGRLLTNNRPRYDQWNDVVRGLEPVIKPLVSRKIEMVVRDNNLPRKPLERMVYLDILRPCMELEYGDVHPPGFFANIAYWYLKGHFPCGWKGVVYATPKIIDGKRKDAVDLYPPGFYDKIAKWYESGDFGDWQGQIPQGKLIVY